MESSLQTRQIFKTLGLAALLVACMGIIVQLQQPKLKILSQSNLSSRDYEREENREDVQVNLFKNLPAFGFDNLFADWGMLQFIQYYGDEEARKKTGYHLSPDYLEVIVNNDPRFVLAYMIISPASSINAGRPDRTISLMNRGLKSLTPDIEKAYYVWLYKGVDELLFLGDIPEAKKSYSMAGDWANQAGNKFMASMAQGTAKFLSTKPDSRRARVGAWFMVYINVPDKETKALAKRNIERLGGKMIFYDNGRIEAIPPKND
jgi:hypothetical protein